MRNEFWKLYTDSLPSILFVKSLEKTTVSIQCVTHEQQSTFHILLPSYCNIFTQYLNALPIVLKN